MTRLELVGKVVVGYLKALEEVAIEGAPMRCAIFGMSQQVTLGIAKAVREDPVLSRQFDVEIPSNDTATHLRNKPIEKSILFAVGIEEMQRIGTSLETITRIETDRLRAKVGLWIDGAGFQIGQEHRQHLEAAIMATTSTHVARSIDEQADYVLAVANHIANGVQVVQALDEALPALRLPRNSGRFDQIPKSKRGDAPAWEKCYRTLESNVRPYLMLEDSNRDKIDEQVRANMVKQDNEPMVHELTSDEKQTIERFLEAELSYTEWCEEQQALVDLDWSRIQYMFDSDKQQRKESLNVVSETQQFLDGNFPDRIDPEDEELFDRFEGRIPAKPVPELLELFNRHKELIATHVPALLAKWERYLFRDRRVHSDFMEGVICALERLQPSIAGKHGVNPKEQHLKVTAQRTGGERLFWQKKNTALMKYFVTRYRGIDLLFDDRVQFDFGEMYSIFSDGGDPLPEENTRKSKEARQVKFEVSLSAGGTEAETIFFWEMQTESIPISLPYDLTSIMELGGEYARLSMGTVSVQTATAKGEIQQIDLADRNTMLDASQGSDGMLVNDNPDNDIYSVCKKCLAKLFDDRILNAETVDRINAHMQEFCALYGKAVKEWVDIAGSGISSDTFFGQAVAYSKLLKVIFREARNDLSRKGVLMPLLKIGVFQIDGNQPAAIVAPWQPLRMAELAAKARRFREVVNDILDSGKFAGHHYFQWRQQEMKSDYYPEICIGSAPNGDGELLVAERSLGGYSVAEAPQAVLDTPDELSAATDARIAAHCFTDVSKQYLELLPHEKYNFSAVLYDAQARALPKEIADQLSNQIAGEEDLQCDLLLVHTDEEKMRDIYEQQNAAILDNRHSTLSSEAALNFLARLRIGFVDTAAVSDNPADVVLLQDVISRRAKVKWKSIGTAVEKRLESHLPPHWSRRRPMGGGDTAAAVYLVCPSQPDEVLTYIDAVHQAIDGDHDRLGQQLPAREIDFANAEIKQQFDLVHELGRWVINYDQLVDRHLLERQGIHIVRHIRRRDSNRNVIVSTKQDPKVLRSLLKQQLMDLGVSGGTERQDGLVRCLIDEATKLSGQVVMRAARHSRNALELIGLVLGMKEVERNFTMGEIGWFFLDDCASWFGQAEEQIADIMAIAPMLEEGEAVLGIAIVETKYVGGSGVQSHKKKSARQLEETVLRLGRALGVDGNNIGRQDWLHIVANLMIENMTPFKQGKCVDMDLFEWTERVRSGLVDIQLGGASYVFVHDTEQESARTAPMPNRASENCVQAVFGRSDVRQAIEALDEHGDSDELGKTHLIWSRTSSSGDETRLAVRGLATFGKEDASDICTTNSSTRKAEAEPRTVVEPSREMSSVNVEPNQIDKSRWPPQLLEDWILEGSEAEKRSDAEDWLDSIKQQLVHALYSYDLEVKVLDARLTPNAARICFRGSDNMTVRKVQRYRNELLTSHAIDVIDIRGAPQEVVVMVRRSDREVLQLKSVWKRRKLPTGAFGVNPSPLFGVDEESGGVLYLNVDEAFEGQAKHGPHTLITGETGSGKGVLVRTLLLDICATNSPANAQIRMIDPKAGMDFPWLSNMPHLVGDIVSSCDDAVIVLQELVEEMERRNRVFADAGVSKLSEYNDLVSLEQKLPRIWAFHEEFADWMLLKDYRKQIEVDVSRLGVKSRASGIHLIMVTQRPDSKVFPMQLRANLTNRLCLKVADQRNSRLILDEVGAERLLGQGHLLAKLSGESGIIRSQVPYSTDEDGLLLQQLISNLWT